VDQLLTTKLFIPLTRPELVSRSRLVDQLNAGLHRKLTLISAPAGFGKTTLVTEWLDNLSLGVKNGNQIENKIAWLSLDEGDNDLARFLTYFIAALNQIDGQETPYGTGGIALLLLNSAMPSLLKYLTLTVSTYVACNLIISFYRKATTKIKKREIKLLRTQEVGQ